MESFRLRVRHTPKKGNIWELHLIPETPDSGRESAAARLLGSASAPAAINWIREVARPFFSKNGTPAKVDEFGPKAAPVFLDPEDGMRLALALSATHYLVTPAQRRAFRERLAQLPSEVVLYWFTLCFYGDRTAAGRAALRTLLTHEEPPPRRVAVRRKQRAPQAPDLFSYAGRGEGDTNQ